MTKTFRHHGAAPWVLACLALAATPAFAADAAAGEAADGTETLGAITVTATRTATPVIDAPATVSVITAADIENQLFDDIKDLVRFEPGVSVRSQPSRFTAAFSPTGRDGNSGFTIRGLDGNRVLIQTDGIRLPDAFSFGAQANGRGDYADLDLLKSVEILRGPASPLYGSDGVAGAVSFTTKDPGDLLAAGAHVGGRLRLGYTDADGSWAKAAALALRDGNLEALLAYTRRDSGPLQNQGTNDSSNVTRTTPNPQETDNDAVLAKLVWAAAPGHRLRATFEHNARTTETNVLSGLALPPLGASSVIGLTARDTAMRDRASLDWRYEAAGLVERASLTGFYQDSRTRQFSAEDRNISADRTRDNRFNNEVYGAAGEIALKFATGDIGHRIITGFDASRTLQTGSRGGTVPPFGETFPTKAFPDTHYTLAGVFVQDEIDIGDGGLLLYPALRMDHYSLDPETGDPQFPGQPASQSGTRLSPKLGAIGWLGDNFGLYASYAAGFKAPTPSQVNNGFINIIQNYTSLANPDLRPETSNSVEAGLRLRRFDLGGVKLNASLTGFYGWYKGFIEQVQISGNFTPASPGVFQYVNIGEVDIGGIEARIEADLGSGLRFDAAAALAHGDRRSGGIESALSSVDPFKLTGGLSYRDSANRFGGQAIITHVAGKAQDRVAEPCSPACFTPGAFTIADLTAFVRPTEWATVRVGIFNLFDARYFWWSDVRGIASSSATIDAFSQPGRNVSASLTLQF
nr:TonB-dependent hemoglobin/transferrin/lactoferrin family receptor [Polymorphobacter sp.]